MRGWDVRQGSMFCYMSLEELVPEDHPLRLIQVLMDQSLQALNCEFSILYSRIGRPSIAPEKLLRASILQCLYTIRSERQLVEQINYNMLYRWFVGLSMDEPVWNATSFTKNRDRLLSGDIAQKLLSAIIAQADEQGWLSQEHFSVDGTLVEAWASHKSFRKVDSEGENASDEDLSGGNPSVDFRGEKRCNQTHRSTTDADARLARKSSGHEARLGYSGNAMIENRHGLVVGARVELASGTAEREAALEMVDRLEGTRRITLGADKGYDVEGFTEELRMRNVVPHVAQKSRHSSIDGRTTRHAGYAVSQRVRKRIEEVFGWAKTIGTVRKVKYRGRPLVESTFVMNMAAYNLVRMKNLTLQMT